jgi:hypothetical protein
LRRNAYADRPEDRSDDDAIDCSTRSTVFMLSFDYVSYLLSFLFVCLLFPWSFCVCCWGWRAGGHSPSFRVVCCFPLMGVSEHRFLQPSGYSTINGGMQELPATFDIWFCGMHFKIC